ncbi:5'-methylthioadenosine/S-adenosylhomocysteine nucleosidase [Collinsella sp. HCP3S3_A7]|uniref:5'-methylthioadenosine/S-adenosylhomocysteine nucleosidase n=1 Tax=unclassified Collinsella TaxID=2637548 RepID=UPI003F8A05A6
MPTIAIIGALEKEVAQIKEELNGAHVSQEAGLSVVSGELNGLSVVATTAGMGTVNAAGAAQHLISKYAPQAVVFSGIAGGLNSKLHINDVVIGKCLRYLDTDTALIAESAPELEEFASTPALVDIATTVLAEHGFIDADASDSAAEKDPKQFLVGTIATGDRFVTGDAMRTAAIDATHADCVEMEGAAIAHIAAKNGVDCLVLRAISDNCDEAYDAFCEREFDLDEYARTASGITLDIVRCIAAA